MRNTKKVISILLTLLMVVGMMSTFAFATGTSTIVVQNAVKGQTYTAYKLFDVSRGSGNAISYRMSATEYGFWHEVLEENGFNIEQAKDASGYVVKGVPSDTSDTAMTELTAKLAKAFDSMTTKPSPAGTAGIGDENKTATITGLDTGYYFVHTSLGAVCALVHDGTTRDVIEKNGKPNVTKTATEQTAMLGQDVHYTVTMTVAGSARTNYVLHDKMSDALQFNNDVVAKVGNNEVPSLNYEVKTTGINDGCTFEVDFSNDYTKNLANNTVITVTYSAKVIKADNNNMNNDLTMKFGNSSIPAQTVTVKTGSITVDKYALNKTDTTDKSKKLEHAKFVIKSSEGYLASENNAYTWKSDWKTAAGDLVDHIVVMDTDANGAATIKGLKAGEYELIEIEAPEGYNKLVQGESFEITVDNLDQTKSIANDTGSTLPETGGIGTTIFYLIGAILVIGAGVVFVTRRRMHSDK